MIALIACFRLGTAVHASQFGDPYHTHGGEPCVIQVLVDKGSGPVSDALFITAPVPQFSPFHPTRINLSNGFVGRAYYIRGPPRLSS
jgi:hypothetical protein